MPPSHRRINDSAGVDHVLAAWVIGAATLGTMLATGPKWAQLIFFVVAGIGWAFPLKPLFGWMNTGPE